jgi:hypothetical protein
VPPLDVVRRLLAAVNAHDIDAFDADTVWTEWRWPLDVAGVIVFGVRHERFAWARLYVEPVEQAGAGISAAVREISGRESE